MTILQKILKQQEQISDLKKVQAKNINLFLKDYDGKISDGDFWESIDYLAKQLAFCESVESATHNLRVSFLGTNKDFIAFYKEYDKKVTIIEGLETLWDEMEVGDDSWRDFCDSIILNKKAYGLITAGTRPRNIGHERFNELVKGWEELYILHNLKEQVDIYITTNQDDLIEELESKEKKIVVKCAVAGNNSNGSPDIFFTKIKVTQEDYDNGKHYELALEDADSTSFDGQTVFDENDDGRAILQLCVWDSIPDPE
jgi:hypothetical protein